jgi:hypothetical protein
MRTERKGERMHKNRGDPRAKSSSKTAKKKNKAKKKAL